MRVGEPAADRHSVLRVEDVRGRGVVDNDRLAQVTADLRQILNSEISIAVKKNDSVAEGAALLRTLT